MGKDRRKQEEWFCRFCTTNGGDFYKNRKGNTSCHSCGYTKDRCFGGKVVPRGERGSPSRRVTGRGGQGDGAGDKVKALEEKNKKLEEKCRRLESGDKDDAADDGAPAAKSEASKKLAADIEDQRKVVKFYQEQEGTPNAVPEGLRLAEVRLQELVHRRQEAKPPSARLREAQAVVTRREKALATAEKSVAELDEQAKKLQEKRATAVATVADARIALVQARTEHASHVEAAGKGVEKVEPAETVDDGLARAANLLRTKLAGKMRPELAEQLASLEKQLVPTSEGTEGGCSRGDRRRGD